MTSGEPATSPNLTMREFLFADLGPADVTATFGPGLDPSAGTPAAGLVGLAAAVQTGDRAAIEAGLTALAADRDMRVRLQAWTLARGAGFLPTPDLAGQVLGVIVDVALDGGVDTVAAFADGAARHLNQAGGGVVVESATTEAVAGAAQRLLAAGQAVADRTGPLDGARPPAPENGGVAIWLLTPGGIHMGRGSYEALAGDGLGGPVMRAAYDLMTALIELSQQSRG